MLAAQVEDAAAAGKGLRLSPLEVAALNIMPTLHGSADYCPDTEAGEN